MKKILLSLFVISTFGAYTLYERSQPTDTVATTPITKNDATTTNTTQPPVITPVTTSVGTFKNGSYTGSSVDAYYGYVQVKAVIHNGALTDITFLTYPNDRHESLEISNRSMPRLKQEAIAAQSAQVSIISGATDTSNAFKESLADALSQAHT